MTTTRKTDVAIVGAGPYGLSIAAHLSASGVEHQIFGLPMNFWVEQMPKGMLLKSEAFASNLYDPNRSFTLYHFCKENGVEYADVGIPVHLETFSAYGQAFQRRFAPDLQRKTLRSLSRAPQGFLLQFDDGELLVASKVVIATGISYFQHIPRELLHLRSDVVSHSSRHSDLERFRGREVVVIGGGSSASDLAVLLHESGAQVRLVARGRSIQFHHKMDLPRSLWKRLRSPMSTLGPSWRSLFYAEAPSLFRCLPEASRLRIVATHLGPAGGWFMKDRFTQVPHLLGYHVKRADSSSDGRVRLQLTAHDGRECELRAEHIIAATGYRVDLDRLPFLGPDIRTQLKSVNNSPILSATFETSLPGLFFVGAIAANSFGPVMRFAAGANFAARRISSHLAGRGSRADDSETVLTSEVAV